MEEKIFRSNLPAALYDDEKDFSKFRISSHGITIVNTINSSLVDTEEDYCCPTLKDLAIFLYEMCGQGVQWQLVRELGERTEIDLIEINNILGDIIAEYANMSDKEAIEKWENSEGYIEDSTIS